LPGEPDQVAEVDATVRGTAIHALLQHLPDHPQANWPHLAAHLVPDPTLRDDVLTEVATVLTQPSLSHLFQQGLAEVAATCDLGDRRLYGIIDRLIIAPDHILAVDYKSNQVIPTTPDTIPEGLLRQLGAYHHLLSQLYPDRRIDTAILWTRNATLMPVDADIVRAALQRATRDGITAP